MYLDTFLGSVGVDQEVVQTIRHALDGYADSIGSVELGKFGHLGGSAAGARMVSDTNLAQEKIVTAMQELQAGLREYGLNLELWQKDMAATDDEANARIQAIRSVQETIAAPDFRNVPAPAQQTGGA